MKKEEFYTPKSIVNMIDEIIEPYKARSTIPAVVMVVCLSNQ